jgi:hypothetical protein
MLPRKDDGYAMALLSCRVNDRSDFNELGTGSKNNAEIHKDTLMAWIAIKK